MKKVFILMMMGFLVSPTVILAHPPSTIELSYDEALQILHIVMTHVSRNPRDHRIRKVTLYRNDEEPLHYKFVTQTSPREFIEEIPLEAVPGDIIRIKAVCSEGGYKEETLTIPNIEPENPETSSLP